jgi:hypothetical protein
VIGVLDGCGGTLARQVVAALGSDARLAAPSEITAAFGCLVVVLPLRTREIEYATQTALTTLGSVAGDPAMVEEFRSGVVLVWAARAEDRVDLAAPRVLVHSEVVDAWNVAPMFLGTAWTRERAQHSDDGSAVRCRSAAIRRMIHTTTHRDVCGISLPDVCTQVGVLDSDHLHASAAPAGPVPPESWPRSASACPHAQITVMEPTSDTPAG